MNEAILHVLGTLPKDKGYRFTPTERSPDKLHINPRDPEHDGVSKDITIKLSATENGTVRVAKASADGVTYCCGVTFEAWFDALPLVGVQPSSLFSPDELQRGYDELVADWFCPVMGHSGCVAALVDRGWGQEVDVRAAQPGDLCQFWRSVDLEKPSGHSVVFLKYNELTKELTYWSSQRATNGIGERTEVVGESWETNLSLSFIARPSLGSATEFTGCYAVAESIPAQRNGSLCHLIWHVPSIWDEKEVFRLRNPCKPRSQPGI
eukprot:gene41645-50820_t